MEERLDAIGRGAPVLRDAADMSDARPTAGDRPADRFDCETSLWAEIDILAPHARLDTDAIGRMAASEAGIDRLAQTITTR